VTNTCLTALQEDLAVARVYQVQIDPLGPSARADPSESPATFAT
jgi:hypothetical protein